MEYKQAELRPEEQVTLTLRGLYQAYGYKKYKMGKFEEYSLYADNRDFLAGDKIITFTDLDGRLMALKPDVTLSIIKNSKISETSVEKLYYIENVYRESRESHTFKEINQMGLEYIGRLDTYGITEVLSLAVKTLDAVSSDYILEISHMSYAVELLGSLGIREQGKISFLKLIREKNVDGIIRLAESENLDDAQKEALAALPMLYGNIPATVDRARKYAVNDIMNGALDQMLEIYEGLKTLDANENVQIDLSIVNDIDYYNGIIFNGYLKELGGCILAGGQYDGALKQLNKKGKAIGFALYLNDISRISPPMTEFDVDAVILYDSIERTDEIAEAVKKLQEKGLSVFAAREISEGLRYREKYTLKKGNLKKEGE